MMLGIILRREEGDKPELVRKVARGSAHIGAKRRLNKPTKPGNSMRVRFIYWRREWILSAYCELSIVPRLWAWHALHNAMKQWEIALKVAIFGDELDSLL